MKKSYENGFVALMSVIFFAAAFLSLVLSNQSETVSLFEAANLKSYRAEAVTNGLFCLNVATIEIVHDYFYTQSVSKTYSGHSCEIESVTGAERIGGNRIIFVKGYSVGSHQKITARIQAEVSMSYQNIQLVSSKVIF